MRQSPLLLRPLAHRKRGSVLIVAAILGSGVALALGSFVALSLHSVKLSSRSFYANSAMNLSEAGIEQAIYALNKGDYTSWSTYNGNNLNKVRLTNSLDLGNGTVGQIKVVIFGISAASPRVVAEGRAIPKTGAAIIKQIEVRLQRRSHWATGMVAKDTVTFSGNNVIVDSFESCLAPYDPNNPNDKGSVASYTFDATAIDLSNADVYGYVAMNGGFKYRNNASVRGKDSPTSGPNYPIDWSRVSHDFSANFDPEVAPTSGFDQDLNGTLNGNVSLGADDTTQLIRLTGNVNATNMTVRGDVTLVVSQNFDIKDSLVITPGSKLTLYLKGNLTTNGAINQTGKAEQLQIFGTAEQAGGQLLKLHGNGIMHAAVYAPNATVELKGGGNKGEMSGAVVGNTIKVTGNYGFHYDECLANIGGSNPFSVARWIELTDASERLSL